MAQTAAARRTFPLPLTSADALGGQTLLGAWTVHALIALVLVVPALGLIRPLSRLSDRLAVRLPTRGRA
ncbi:MAG: hypothetical protein ACRDQB_10660 [Thermocrispum sp.]